MNIHNVIKIYFVFMMCAISIGALSYNETAKTYFASVINLAEWRSNDDASEFTAGLINPMEELTLSFSNDDPGLVNFRILNDPETAFAGPGEDNVEAMQFEFRTGDEGLKLSSLNLKIEGIDPSEVEGATLFTGENIIGVGKINEGYINFSDINFIVENNNREIATLIIDLGEDLHTGQRVRMDIEKPEDLGMKVSGKDYFVNGYYPIKGKYVSIAKEREW